MNIKHYIINYNVHIHSMLYNAGIKTEIINSKIICSDFNKTQETFIKKLTNNRINAITNNYKYVTIDNDNIVYLDDITMEI